VDPNFQSMYFFYIEFDRYQNGPKGNRIVNKSDPIQTDMIEYSFGTFSGREHALSISNLEFQYLCYSDV